MTLIKSICCNYSDITEYVDEPINDLDSTDSPTFKSGLDIVLSTIKPATNATTAKRQRPAS